MLTVIPEAESRAQQCLSSEGEGQAQRCVHMLACSYKEVQYVLMSLEKTQIEKHCKHSVRSQRVQPTEVAHLQMHVPHYVMLWHHLTQVSNTVSTFF